MSAVVGRPVVATTAAEVVAAQLAMSWQSGIPHASQESCAVTDAAVAEGEVCAHASLSWAPGEHIAGCTGPSNWEARSRIVADFSITTRNYRFGVKVPRRPDLRYLFAFTEPG